MPTDDDKDSKIETIELTWIAGFGLRGERAPEASWRRRVTSRPWLTTVIKNQWLDGHNMEASKFKSPWVKRQFCSSLNYDTKQTTAEYIVRLGFVDVASNFAYIISFGGPTPTWTCEIEDAAGADNYSNSKKAAKMIFASQAFLDAHKRYITKIFDVGVKFLKDELLPIIKKGILLDIDEESLTGCLELIDNPGTEAALRRPKI